MEFINSNKYGELTETATLQFETIINHRLPSEYRAYLQAKNLPLFLVLFSEILWKPVTSTVTSFRNQIK
ncbi:hypothetical protein Pjdr2_4933 [Paenibacillus sp. JDR-2]|nr:hypothetical protein Pjdr2_4933 [Paenibacillus sp. JDR-2]